MSTKKADELKLDEILESVARNCICKYKVENDGVPRVIGVCVCHIDKKKKEAKKAIRAREQAVKEQADRKSLETIAALLNGDHNQVTVVQNYIRNKLEMYAQNGDNDE